MASAAVVSRREQIKRWVDYYDGTDHDRTDKKREPAAKRVRFPPGVVFLAAAQSGSIEETVRLLDNGADPNSSTADGLTAQHQCCIDGNLDMLKVLVEHGANTNAKDNEGWTPLHAAASCDREDIVEFLLEQGADVTAINSEGEIALDLCDEDSECLGLLKKAVSEQNISLEEARAAEKRVLLADALAYRDEKKSFAESLFGATPLHVACAKGYEEVIRTLLETQFDVDAKDDDGWTPLHAAAHWGEKTACELLTNAGADFNCRTPSGQTPIQLADSELVPFLEKLRESQPPKKIATPTPAKEVVKENFSRSDSTKRRGSISRTRAGSTSKMDMSAERSRIAEFRQSIKEENQIGKSSSEQRKPALGESEAVPLKPPSFSPKPPSTVTATSAASSAAHDASPTAIAPSPVTLNSTAARSSASESATTASKEQRRGEESAVSPDGKSLAAGVARRTSSTSDDPKPPNQSVRSRRDSQDGDSPSTSSSSSDRHQPSKSPFADRLAQFGGGRHKPDTNTIATVAEPTSNTKTVSPTPATGTAEAEPEAVRRQRARRSRENRRVTQHVRLEDLLQASTSPSPDQSDEAERKSETPVPSSAEPSVVDSSNASSALETGSLPDKGATRNAEPPTNKPVAATSTEDRKTTGSRSSRQRRNRAKRRPTGIIALGGEGNSDSDGDSDASNISSTQSPESPNVAVADDSKESHSCSCSSRLVELETQISSMTELLKVDRSRMLNLEKELKQLREENRALIRVIAKLSRSS